MTLDLEVARDKETEQVVGFLHADKGEKELLIGHLKATSLMGFQVLGFGCQGFGFRL